LIQVKAGVGFRTCTFAMITIPQLTAQALGSVSGAEIGTDWLLESRHPARNNERLQQAKAMNRQEPDAQHRRAKPASVA
jgi:hypothetical protein